LKLYDFSRFKRAAIAPAFFAEVLVVEVLVAEVLTQRPTPFAGPRGSVMRKRAPRGSTELLDFAG
jgi:hypothetical protein